MVLGDIDQQWVKNKVSILGPLNQKLFHIPADLEALNQAP